MSEQPEMHVAERDAARAALAKQRATDREILRDLLRMTEDEPVVVSELVDVRAATNMLRGHIDEDSKPYVAMAVAALWQAERELYRKVRVASDAESAPPTEGASG